MPDTESLSRRFERFQDILARDHFIETLYEEDLRLRVRQARPPFLQVALETALELESFQLASRHRTRMFRGAVGNIRLAEETGDELPSNQGGARCESKLDELNKLMTRLLKEIKAGSCGRFSNNRYRRSPERERRKCWTCGVQDHLAKDCKRGPPNEIKTTRETKDEQSGNERRSSYLRIVLDRTIKVAGNSEIVISAKLDGTPGEANCGAIGPAAITRRTKGIIVGRTLVDLKQNNIPVWVVNLSSSRKKLSKGTEIAVCEPVACITPMLVRANKRKQVTSRWIQSPSTSMIFNLREKC